MDLSKLTPEQRAVVETWGQGQAVLAGAGCGKTTTLVMKCLALLQKNPEARFAAVSFTEKSAGDLREKLASKLAAAGVPGGLGAGHVVTTIHGLCGSVIREFPREAGFDGEESVMNESEATLLWEQSIEKLWFDDLPPEIEEAFDRMTSRESRDSLLSLLQRVKSLRSFGVLERLEADGRSDADSVALSRLARYVLEHYDRLKRRRGMLDFDDLERGAERALESPKVRENFQRRFELVMVDEFQDTNPVQAAIITRFVREGFTNLCVVGDPKQSIYRFRDADVSVFEDFCSKLPVRQRLTWNFRSRPGIIDFVNRVCDPIFEASQLTYDALDPKREAGDAFEPVLRLDIQQPEELGRWVRSEVERGVPLHDMVLLLRKIRGNEKWLKGLSAAGIPLAVGSGGLFWEDARVREITAFLKWWDNPGNALSGAVFLRAPWVGVPDGELDVWFREGRDPADAFFATGHPIARALAPHRGRLVRPGELLMALLVNEEVEREVGSPLLGLWHRAEELSSRGLDFHSVVAELALAMEESRRERDVPPPRNLGQLTVMTLHAAKGLEFPHVILADLAGKKRASDAPLLFWDRNDGIYLGGRDEGGDRDTRNPAEKRWRELEKRKDLAESKRVFYVALTRPKERLILAMLPAPACDPEKAPFEDNWRGWVEPCAVDGQVKCLSASAIPVGGADVGPAGTHEEDGATLAGDEISSAARPALAQRRALELKRPRHSVTEWNTLSRCPRNYEWSYIRPRASAGSAAPGAGGAKPKKPAALSPKKLATLWGVAPEGEEQEGAPGLSARELGTRVHACLEVMDLDGLRDLERETEGEFRSDPLIEWAESSEVMRGAASDGREVWAELSFELPAGDEVVVGSIDRLIVDRSGERPRYRVVDFKVTRESKPDEELLDSYATQMRLYAWAVDRLESGSVSAPLEIEGELVNISSTGVRSVSIDLQAATLRGFVELLSKQAARIVAGEPAQPKPGRLCAYCDFSAACPEGQAQLTNPRS